MHLKNRKARIEHLLKLFDYWNSWLQNEVRWIQKDNYRMIVFRNCLTVHVKWEHFDIFRCFEYYICEDKKTIVWNPPILAVFKLLRIVLFTQFAVRYKSMWFVLAYSSLCGPIIEKASITMWHMFDLVLKQVAEEFGWSSWDKSLNAWDIVSFYFSPLFYSWVYHI